MNTLSIPVGIMASISFYVGFYHFLIYGRRRQHREDLTFALLCLATGLYDVFCIGLYSATSVAEGVQWQRAQFIALALFTTAFLWFVSDYTRQKPSIVTYAFSAFFVLALAVQVVDRSNLTWMVASPSVKAVMLPFGLEITYYEATFGPFTTVQSLTGMVASTYVLLSGIHFYRRGYKREAGPLLLAMAFMYAAALNDTAVSNGLYKFVYMIEYGYMAIILLMAYSLSNTVVEAAMAKESLRKTEERFRALVETTSDWVWETDRNGVYTYASPKVRELLGYEPEGIIGKTPFDLMPPDEARRVGTVFQEIVAHQKVFARLENTAQHKDGQLVVLETSGVPFFDTDGNILGYRGIDRDITERRRTDRARQESEQKFRTVVQNAQAVIFILDKKGIFMLSDGQALARLGLVPGQVVGMSAYDVYGDNRSVLDGITKALGGELTRFTSEVQGIVFDTVCSPYYGLEGELTGVIGIAIDITERKRAEEALQMFQYTVDRASDAVQWLNRDAGFEYVNEQACRSLGYTREELMHLHLWDIDPIYPKERWDKNWEGYQEGKQGGSENVETLHRRKDGSVFPVEVSSNHLWFGDRELHVAVVRDITERKRVEEALRESEQRFRTLAEASFEGIGLSEQGIIVDLNDQLAQMLGYARDELIGTPVMEFVAPESRDRVIEAIRSGRLEPYEHLALRKDGTVFPIEVRARTAQIASRQLRVSAIRDITERRRAEEALRESEQRFQLFMLHFPGLAYIKDAATRVLFANQGFMDYLNLAPSAILGKTNRDIFPAEFGEHITADDQRVLESGASGVIEERYGGRIWSTYKFVISPTDKPPLLGGFTLDITERKQAEEALRESQLLLRALIDAVPLWIAYVDMDGKYVIANQKYVETFGKPLHEIEGAHYSQVLPSDLYARHKSWVDECFTGKTVPFNDVLQLGGNGPTYVYGVYTPLYGPDGQMQGATAFVVDITERKRAEEALKRYAAQAQQRAEQLATMNEIGHAVSTLQDLDSVLEIIYHQVQRIVLADAFYIGLCDAERKQVTFPLMYDAGSRYNEPALPLVQAPWIAQVIQTGKPFVLHRTVEDLQTPLVGGLGSPQRKSASVLIVPLWRGESVIGVLSAQSYTMNAYTDEHARILTGIGHQAAIAIGNAQLYEQAQQEIAERKRVQAEREQLIAELEAKNAELERFAYTVSHDLKAPLITIRGFLGFVEKDALAGNLERVRADMKRITQATDKMQQLLNELLELSRIGRMMNPPQAVPFETIVREALELVRGSIQERSVQVKVADDLPLVYGDHARLVEVVQNLMDNACKFMGDQPKPRIEIGQRGTDADGKPILFVRDNGIGIESQYHDQVFGLFNKLDAQTEGTGVGLALVKRIIEVHGGKIWLESEPGQGSTFYFTIPSCHQ